MKFVLSSVCLAGLSLALAACGSEQKTAQKGTAEGEILPGSASDAMLPYDTLRSQPPLAPLSVATGKPGAKPARTGDAGPENSEAADQGPGEEPTAAAAAEPKAAE